SEAGLAPQADDPCAGRAGRGREAQSLLGELPGGVAVAECFADGDGEPVSVRLAVAVGLAVAECFADGDGEPVSVRLAVAVGLAVAECEPVAERLTDGHGDADKLDLGLADLDHFADAEHNRAGRHARRDGIDLPNGIGDLRRAADRRRKWARGGRPTEGRLHETVTNNPAGHPPPGPPAYRESAAPGRP